MNWRDFMVLLYFVIAAIIFGIVSWVTLSPANEWVAPVVVVGFVSIGLGVNSLLLANHTDKKIEAMNGTLKNIEQIQQSIQTEQKEQSNSRSPIIPTLEAFTQLYLDYLAKQQTSEENQKGGQSGENS